MKVSQISISEVNDINKDQNEYGYELGTILNLIYQF